MSSIVIGDQIEVPTSRFGDFRRNKGDIPHTKSEVKYRPDIDGMRAVAVLSVLAYHIGFSKVSGGFVGVDVFFVISGYLISAIVFSEIAGSRFSVVGFYERRIRRIFPALFTMLGVFSIFALIYLLPSELVNYSKSMLAATISGSNFYFWQHSGYFDAATSQPLLHTWSLAVEEQFYILFPLFLVLVRKFLPRRLRISVVVLFFMSLLLSIVVVSQNRNAAFYMPYTRAWELLLGTILALNLVPSAKWGWQRNLAAIAGAGMIVFSILDYTQNTLFPGFSAIPPCVGSALIIWAGESGPSLVGSILSWRPVVFIGLISYSLYLWHWPVIMLQQEGVLISGSSITSRYLSAHRFDMLFEIFVSFILAVLSWRFIERPFRSGRLRLRGRPLFILAAAVVIALLALSSTTIAAGGFPGRFPSEALKVASSLGGSASALSPSSKVCFITTEDSFDKFDHDACLREVSDKKNYLLLGDSHSAMLAGALSGALGDVNIMQASTAACEPSLHPAGFPNCKQMMNFIFTTYLPRHSIQGMYIVGRWEAKDMGPLGDVIAWCKQQQIPVTIFGPVPEYDAPLPRLLAYSITWDEPSLARQHLVASLGPLDSEMKSLAANVWHVPYISLYRAICSMNGCIEYADSAHTIPLMDDTDHLNSYGAAFVVDQLVADGALR